MSNFYGCAYVYPGSGGELCGIDEASHRQKSHAFVRWKGPAPTPGSTEVTTTRVVHGVTAIVAPEAIERLDARATALEAENATLRAEVRAARELIRLASLGIGVFDNYPNKFHAFLDRTRECG